MNRRVSRHFVFLLAVVFLPGVQVAGGAERSSKPVLYNMIAKEGEPIDQAIRELYAGKYDLVELRNQGTFVSAKLTKTSFPNPVFDEQNREVSGLVRVCFVIDSSGRLVDPFVFGLANPVLTGPVLQILKQFRRGSRANQLPALKR